MTHVLKFDQINRIVVLRGGGLGDLIMAEPAIRGLKATYPEAEITLAGFPSHAQLLMHRPSAVSHVEVLPPAPGIREGTVTHTEVTDFSRKMRAQKFDLAVQIHGGGAFSNPFIKQFGARHTIGSATAQAEPLERTLNFEYYQHETLRSLEVVALAGVSTPALEPRIAVLDLERAGALKQFSSASGPIAVIHPGATDPRRQWPQEKFAAVAHAVIAGGGQVFVIGDRSESALCDSIVRNTREWLGPSDSVRVHNLADRLSMSELVGLLSVADVVVGNDSGPRHLAQAVGTATVSVYWVGNLINAGPLQRRRNRVHIGWTTRCSTCDIDLSNPQTPRCAHNDSLVASVDWKPVAQDAIELMARSHQTHGR